MKLGLGLYGNTEYENVDLIEKRKYLKIFDRNHNILDECFQYSNLKYTWTLNGLGKCEVDIPLESVKCTQENFEFRNHIEVWDSLTNNCIWGGQIVDRGFTEGKLHISCFGYMSLLKWRRLRSKVYSEMTYSNLFIAMINDTNAIENTLVAVGNLASNTLRTQRTVENKDFLLDKLLSFIEDCNYDIEVDNNRKFNLYTKKGQSKLQYVLEYGGDADNILIAPSLSQSCLDLANSMYAESKSGDTTITSLATDTISRDLFGLMEGVSSSKTDITIQSTLDNYCNSDLQKNAYPSNSISLKIKDSSLAPFDMLEVGDTVSIHLIPYWNFSDKLRILEITHNEDDNTRDIVVGETLYRPAKPQKRKYAK